MTCHPETVRSPTIASGAAANKWACRPGERIALPLLSVTVKCFISNTPSCRKRHSDEQPLSVAVAYFEMGLGPASVTAALLGGPCLFCSTGRILRQPLAARHSDRSASTRVRTKSRYAPWMTPHANFADAITRGVCRTRGGRPPDCCTTGVPWSGPCWENEALARFVLEVLRQPNVELRPW